MIPAIPAFTTTLMSSTVWSDAPNPQPPARNSETVQSADTVAHSRAVKLDGVDVFYLGGGAMEGSMRRLAKAATASAALIITVLVLTVGVATSAGAAPRQENYSTAYFEGSMHCRFTSPVQGRTMVAGPTAKCSRDVFRAADMSLARLDVQVPESEFPFLHQE